MLLTLLIVVTVRSSSEQDVPAFDRRLRPEWRAPRRAMRTYMLTRASTISLLVPMSCVSCPSAPLVQTGLSHALSHNTVISAQSSSQRAQQQAAAGESQLLLDPARQINAQHDNDQPASFNVPTLETCYSFTGVYRQQMSQNIPSITPWYE